jgi:hypothetical protein
MKTIVPALLSMLACASCADNFINGRLFGYENRNEVLRAAASLSLQGDHSMRLLLNRRNATCTAFFKDAPAARASEVAPMSCSDTSNGTATLSYSADARPSRVTYQSSLEGTSIAGSVGF